MSNQDKKLFFFRLCGVSSKARGSGPRNFLFHLMFLPAASFLPGEGFSMVALVARITSIERGVINLLSYPSLPCHDWRSAKGALVRAADDHLSSCSVDNEEGGPQTAPHGLII
jgi:hypothetical protein